MRMFVEIQATKAGSYRRAQRAAVTLAVAAIACAGAVSATASSTAHVLFADEFEGRKPQAGDVDTRLAEGDVLPGAHRLSSVSCSAGTKLGVVYVVEGDAENRRAEVVNLWSRPADGVHTQPIDRKERKVRMKSGRSQPISAQLELASEMTRGKRILFTAMQGETKLFDHTFNLEDCAALSVAEATPPSKRSKRSNLICTQEKRTGSRIGKRVCRTQSQIDAERERARDELGRRPVIPTGSGGR